MLRTLLFLCTILLNPFLITASPAQQPTYSILVVEEMLGRVTILAADDPQRRASVAVGFKPHEIAISPDGRTAFISNFGLSDADTRVGTPGTTISAVDIASATIRRELRLPGSLKAPHGLAFRPHHGNDLFINAELGDQMVVFNSNTAQVERVFPLPEGVHNFVFSIDGSALFAFSPKGLVYCINPDSGKLQATRDLGSPVRGLAWTSDSTQLIVSSKSEISLLAPSDLFISKRFPIPTATQIFYSAATPDGRFILAPSVFDGDVKVINASDGSVVRRIHTGTPLKVIVSPDPNLAFVGNVGPAGDHLTVIDLQTFETRDIPGMRDANGLAFSPISLASSKVAPAH